MKKKRRECRREALFGEAVEELRLGGGEETAGEAQEAEEGGVEQQGGVGAGEGQGHREEGPGDGAGAR